jgi:hypothetical protein
VEAEARDLTGESFTRFMSQLYKRIHALVARCLASYIWGFQSAAVPANT